MTRETEMVLAISLVVGVPVLFFVLRWLSEKRRTRMMEQAATALGFKFSGKGKDENETNIITGSSGDIKIRVSDRKWTESKSKTNGTRTYRESRILLTCKLLVMPTFTITHEGIIEKALTATIGMQDIDFDSHPEFSKNYLLQCKNEEACRAFFTDSILAKFKIAKGVTVKGSSQTLLVYRSKRKIRSSNLRSALEEAFQIYSYFHEQTDNAS